MSNKRVESLYILILRSINSNHIDFSSCRLPKTIHKDINIFATKCNDNYYFTLIHNDFDLFCDLLLSDYLNKKYFIVFLKNNIFSLNYIVSRYLNRNIFKDDYKFGLALGIILRQGGKIDESEKVLRSALENSSSICVLLELLHVYVLQRRNNRANEIYDILREKVFNKLEDDEAMVNIYDKLTWFCLVRDKTRFYPFNWNEAKFWNDKSLKVLSENENSIKPLKEISIFTHAICITLLMNNKDDNCMRIKVKYLAAILASLKRLFRGGDIPVFELFYDIFFDLIYS